MKIEVPKYMTFLRVACLLALVFGTARADGPKKITQAEAMAAVVTKVAPEYPPMAKQLKLSGMVEVELVVGENGAVESATPVSGSPVLTRPAVEALKKWKFKPFQADGAPSKAMFVLKVNFERGGGQ
jgi:protein TonB